MNIFVAGGVGYIGSHTCVELLNQGHEVVIYDNCSNSDPNIIKRIEEISQKSVHFVKGDILDENAMREVFCEYEIDAVLHFAALKAVGESVADPISYYKNNVNGSVCLLEVMRTCGVKTIIFSSSATVYGDPAAIPITEDESIKPTNPYGRTKSMTEQILIDIQNSCPDMHVGILRYFNPVGAHPSGLIGEAPNGIPSNLVPFVAEVAAGKRKCVNIFGIDYPTFDGTGVRDYIHVVDLALAHIAALNYLVNGDESRGPLIVNLGTGKGFSVLQVIESFERVSGRKVPRVFVERRPGDIAECFADCGLAEKLLGWKSKYNLDEMCRDSWAWQLARDGLRDD